MENGSGRNEFRESPITLEDPGAHDASPNIMKRIGDLLFEVRDLSFSGARTNVLDLNLQVLAKNLYSSRRSVDECFGMAGFSTSPAWDIMLDLFQNEEKGKRVSITSACIGAACASTTALRWIDVLVTRTLIERKDDPKDKRRSYVVLTARGRHATIDALKAHAWL